MIKLVVCCMVLLAGILSCVVAEQRELFNSSHSGEFVKHSFRSSVFCGEMLSR